MYSVLYPESNLGRLSRMVPETLRIPSRDMLEQCDGIQFPVSANAKTCFTPSAVLDSYFGKTVKRLKEYVDFPHISSITRPRISGKCTYAFRIRLWNRVNICNRHYNVALGYGVDRILGCGGW